MTTYEPDFNVGDEVLWYRDNGARAYGRVVEVFLDDTYMTYKVEVVGQNEGGGDEWFWDTHTETISLTQARFPDDTDDPDPNEGWW